MNRRDIQDYTDAEEFLHEQEQRREGMTMREKIARALQAKAATFTDPVHFYVEGEAARRFDAAGGDSAEDDRDWTLESWLILADAVLADALRDLTEEMEREGQRYVDFCDTKLMPIRVVTFWKMMVDVMLGREERPWMVGEKRTKP